MSEIEKYYNGEIHVDFDKEIEEIDFGKAVEIIVESDFNKDLNKCLDVVKELDKKDNEIEKLKSIIKEVREYIVKNIENTTQKLDIDNMKCYNSALIELQEILDKENKDGER